ncbi:MAG: hypothetical protein JJD98_00290 [Polaromonas sp.]|nr:hypothetical protein [Polaromonas sp.]
MAYISKYREKWRAQVQKMGVRESSVFDTKREAQAWAIRKESELGSTKGARGQTFGAAVAHYLETVSPEKRDAVDWERRRFEDMTVFFKEDTLMVKIDSATIGKWRDWRLTGEKKAGRRPVSGSTVQRESNLLRHLFTLAKDEWRWIADHPFRGVRLPAENESRDQVWRWQQIKRILRAGQRSGGKIGEVAAAFHIALRSSMRLSEALVAPEVYDPRRRVVVFAATKTGGRSERPVPPKAGRLLTRAPFKVGPNEASVLFSKLCKQQMIKGLTFHDARATAMTLLARKVDVMTLARISGNKDINLLFNTYYRESAEQIANRL